MAKRKSLNKRYSRYSRGSGGSDVLNPDTNILGDEYPYWWKNLENNTIYRPSTDSTNFNQTSRRLNSNTSIRTSNNSDNEWWKDLEETSRNLRSLQKRNDLSNKDATDAAMSESEEEVKIAKKKPPLRSEAKKIDGNAFLNVLNDSRVLLVPLEKDPAILQSSFAQKCLPPTVLVSRESSSSGSPVIAKPKPKILRKEHRNRNSNAFEEDKLSTPSKRKSLRHSLPMDKRFSNAQGSSVIASSTNPREAQDSLNENVQDLSNFSLPKATSTLLDNSIFQQTTNAENSNSDTEPIVMKPKSKLLRRHNRDTKKNLFESILMEEKIDEDEDEERPLPASAVVDESAEEPEPRIEVDETMEEPQPRIVEDESKLADANASKKLYGKTGLHSASDSSDTSSAFLKPTKPKSKFLREARRSHRENFFQRILDDSDLSIANVDSNVSKEVNSMSQNDKSTLTKRRPSIISAESNACSEDMHLRLSNSSSDVDIIRTADSKVSSSRNNTQIRSSSRPEDSISNAGRTSPVLGNERSRNVSREKRSQLLTGSDEECDKDSDVTLIIPESVPESLSQSLGPKEPSDIVLMQPEVSTKERKSSVDIKDSDQRNVDDGSGIEFGDFNRSRKRSTSRSARKIATEERTVNSQERSSPAISNETSSRRSRSLGRSRKRSASRLGSASEMDKSSETPRTQGKRSITARISAIENDEKTRELENNTPRRSKRSEVIRRTSETEYVRTPKRETAVAKRSVSQTIREIETGAVESPLMKQSKRSSKVQEQVSTPVKENEPAEIENSQLPTKRQSKRTSKIETEAVESPSRKQSKRTSKVQEQVSSPVKEDEPAEIENSQPPTKRQSKRTSKIETEAGESPSRKQSKRTSKVQEQVSSPVKENEPGEIENSQPPTKRQSKRTSKIETEAVESPSRKQSKRTSKVQEQVLTPVKENEPAEMEDVPLRPSQRSSRTRRGVSVTSGNESEIENSQPPAKRQSKRTSKVVEQVLTSVRENETAELQDVAPRTGQRPSRSRKTDSLSFASESETGNSPAKRQIKRTSKTQEHVLTPVKENEPAEIEDVAPRPSQRSSRSGRGISLTLANESEMIENSQTPAKRQIKRASKVQEQVLTSVKENDQARMEDVASRTSQRPSRSRKVDSPSFASESETGNSPAKRQIKRVSKVQEQVLTSVRENEPAEIEDVDPRTSQRPSRSRKAESPSFASESEIGSSQSPAEKQSRGTNKALDQAVSSSVKESEAASTPGSRKPSRTRRNMSLMTASESGTEHSVVPTPKRKSRVGKGSVSRTVSEAETDVVEFPSGKQNKRVSNVQEQPVAIAVIENGSMQVENAARKRSQRPSKIAMGSESETEDEELTLVNRSRTQQRMEPTKAEGTAPTTSQRLRETQKGPSLFPDSDSDEAEERIDANDMHEKPENTMPRPSQQSQSRKEDSKMENLRSSSTERSKRSGSLVKRRSKPRRMDSDSKTETLKSPTKRRNEGTDGLEKQTFASTGNELLEAEGARQTRTNRQSKARRVTSLLSSSDLEEERVEPPARNQSERIDRLEKQTIATENEPLEAEGVRQTRTNRQSKARRITSLLSSSDLEEERVESPARNQSKRIDRLEKASTENEPLKAEGVRQTRTNRQSKARRVTSLRSSSNFEEQRVQSPARNQSERIDRLEKQTIASTENKPLETEGAKQTRTNRQSKARRVTSLLSSSDLEEERVEPPARNQSERMNSLEKQSVAIDAANTERRRSQWQNSVREATRLHFTTESNSEDGGSDTLDEDEPARAKYSAQSRSRRFSNVSRAGSLLLRNESEAEDDPSPTKNQSGRRTQLRVVSIDSQENRSSVLSSQFVENFLEMQPSDLAQSERRSIMDKRKVSAVGSPSAIPTSSTSLNVRSGVSGRRPTLSRVDHSEDTEEENEKTEVDGAWQVSAVRELESASSKRSTMQERFETVSNREKRKSRSRSGSKFEENMAAKTSGELERRSRESLPSRKNRSGVSIRSIARLDKSIENVGIDRSPSRSALRVAADQNAERVGFDSPSRKLSRPGPSGKSGSLRQASLNRLETESGRGGVGEEERDNRSKIMLGRASTVKAGPGKAKASTAPQGSEKNQRNIRDFFETKAGATSASQGLSNVQTAQEIRKKLEEIKKLEIERTKEIRKLAGASEKNKFGKGSRPRPKNSVPKKVHKAYLVNGQVYKQPRLPRPMRWVTDRLYRYLWKQMEPKYNLDTRVQSEKFVRHLSEVTSVIAKRKSYQSYKNELHSLMKEMARHRIIHSRNDFYHFCYDFLPYELRVKMVPILLPGNQTNVPYDPDKLHEPLLTP